MRINRLPPPLEASEQRAVIDWAARSQGAYPDLKMLYAIPNGGSRHPAEAANLKRQGVKAGVPDLFLSVARGGYHGLYIEMKRRGEKPRSEQVDWLTALTEQGYYTTVCYGADMAIATLTRYLSMKPTARMTSCSDKEVGIRG